MFSKNELILLAHFEMKMLAAHSSPLLVYAAMAQKAFVDNDQTPFAAALRRGLQHLEKGSRNTPEFEKLITV